MTLVCVLGTELSARVQNVMIFAQVVALLVFAVVALAKVIGGTAPEGSLDPELSWLSPFALEDTGVLVSGLLIGVFIYWGWESAVNLTEETQDSETTPGKAAVLSTVILLVTYLSVAIAVVAFAGLDRVAEFEDDDAILSTLATDVLGSPWDQLVVLAVLTSALASTQTTILPASRTVLSMARAAAMPGPLGRIHPRYLTPHVSTIVIGILATIWYVVVNSLSENFLFDTLSALSLMIAFYYALSGIACVIYYRRELTKSVRNFLFIGVAPLTGGLAARVPVHPLGVRPRGPRRVVQRRIRARPRRAARDRRVVPAARLRAHAHLALRAPHRVLPAPRLRGGRARGRRRPGAPGRGAVSMLVVGFDDSPGARRALDVAIEVAQRLGEGLVIGFAAQPPGRRVGDEYRAHAAALRERGQTLTNLAVGRAREAGVEAEGRVADLRPVDMLLELADEHAARAIVVGTYGESALRGAVLGSTPHKLLHLSRVPVLAVPA